MNDALARVLDSALLHRFPLHVVASFIVIFLSAVFSGVFLNRLRRRTSVKPLAFVPFTEDTSALCVDCRHPTAPQLTHHRGASTPDALRADTSTAIVLKAIKDRHPCVLSDDAPHRGRVTCNHFDADGLGAVWAAVAPESALARSALLAECARVGDFRELDTSRPHGRAALAWNVWVNAVERKLFWRPFHLKSKSEASESADKYDWFLPRCQAALDAAEKYGSGGAEGAAALAVLRSDAPEEFDAELGCVLRDVADFASAGGAGVRRYDPLGLVVLRPPRPLHYYALFGATAGCDVVATIYPGRRYELEQKYTGYVALASRAGQPRLSLVPLAAALTAAERAAGGAGTWVADSLVDSGPLLRLETPGSPRLSKAQRYGHPYERAIEPSALAPEAFEATIVSFHEHGLAGAPTPRPGAAWTWEQIHEHNGRVDWAAWRVKTRGQ